MTSAARGRVVSGVDKPWRDAIRLAANRPGEDGRKKLALIAEKVVDAAVEGDLVAAKEVGDRLDGKAMQPIQHNDAPFNPDSMSDEELAAIASGRGKRAAPSPEDTTKLH